MGFLSGFTIALTIRSLEGISIALAIHSLDRFLSLDIFQKKSWSLMASTKVVYGTRSVPTTFNIPHIC